MEKQMRAERDRRAAILTAEGVKQSQILTAEGEKQAAVLRADGDRQARILQAAGQAKAIETVVGAIHAADMDSTVMAYQYLQALPQIAQGASNKLWIIPAELSKALEGISAAFGGLHAPIPPAERPNRPVKEPDNTDAIEAAKAAAEAVARIEAEAKAETAGTPVPPAAPQQ
jgi:hypothetical protein